VREIIQYKGATKMPNIPHYMEGVINLRGKIIPVIDLAVKFAVDANKLADKRAVILETAGGEVAVIVDEVTEVATLQNTSIESVPATMTCPYLRGIGKTRDRLLLLLDVDRIFGQEEFEVVA
jgi:purine-binding chemotaxis protein CheW